MRRPLFCSVETGETDAIFVVDSFFLPSTGAQVATMMSSELLGKHVIGRLDWGEPALADPVTDQFTDGVARSQVIWT